MGRSDLTSRRVASTAELCALIGDARARGWRRALDGTWVGELDPDGAHVLVPVLVHDDMEPTATGTVLRGSAHVRCVVYAKAPGQVAPQLAVLDVAVDRLRALPHQPPQTAAC